MRRLRGVAIGAVFGVLLTGCTVASSGAPPHDMGGPASGTIVWFANSITQSGTADPRQVLIDAFEERYPSIKVNLVAAPMSTDDDRNTLISEISSKSGSPDVYLGDVIWPAEFARRGLALPLSRYLPASFWRRFVSSGASSRTDRNAGSDRGETNLVGEASYQGTIYAAPLFVDEGMLYYRSDLLAAAGLRPPTTWQELVSDAAILRRDNEPYQFAWQGSAYEGLTCDWIEYLTDAAGGAPAGGTSSAAAIATRLGSPAALRALEFMRSLIARGVTPSSVADFQETQAYDTFDTGQAAFLRGWGSSYVSSQSAGSAIVGRVGVEPLPNFQGQSTPGWSTLGGWDLYVNPYSRNLNADLTFLSWLTGSQAQRILAEEYSEIPGNAAVRDDPTVVRQSPVLRVADSTRLVARPTGVANYPEVSRDIYDQVNAVLRTAASSGGGVAPCEALLRAAHAVDSHATVSLRCPTGTGS